VNTAFGSPALALLLRLKLRGLLRRQWRRLRTPRGFLLTLVGAAAFASWIGSLTLSSLRPAAPLVGVGGELRVRAFGAMLVVISLSTALTNRGLYLPKSEIERLFSAPLSRAQLVRYRLLASGLRSLVGGIVLGLFGAQRMPEPALAFAGILLSTQTLSVVTQLVAILLGGLERRAAGVLRSLGSVLLFTSLAGTGMLVVALAAHRSVAGVPFFGPLAEPFLDGRSDPFGHPLLAAVTVPLVPWARLIASDSAQVFALWFTLCLGLHVLFGELCARLPIDFRELSLATSARGAGRVRLGGGVATLRADSAAARWRIPWLFGRGPAGAIAWRKSAGMARKAKGGFWVALGALAFIVFLAHLMAGRSGPERTLGTPLMIATLGTIYLCSGLRFDFREELERMDVIRAWPIHPARVFLATLLPEVVLVTLLLAGTVLVEALLSRGLSVEPLGVVLGLPSLVFAWVAMDNLVFLFAPVRLVPGQDGFVQNAGRRMIQMMLLLALAVLLGGLGLLAETGAGALAESLGAAPEFVLAAQFASVLLVFLAGDVLLVLLGGIVLRRFDVARDRG
jgi:hypothetical protein